MADDSPPRHYFGMSLKQAVDYYPGEELVVLHLNSGEEVRLPSSLLFDNSAGELGPEQFNIELLKKEGGGVLQYKTKLIGGVNYANCEAVNIIEKNHPGLIVSAPPTLGLHEFDGVNGLLKVYTGRYSHALRTNQVPDFIRRGKPLREVDSTGTGKHRRLKPLKQSGLYNQLGVDLLVKTSDDRLIIAQRPTYDKYEGNVWMGVSVWPSRWNTPTTFVVEMQNEWEQESFTLADVIHRALANRFEIDSGQIEETVIFGVSRSLMMAGTPTVHGRVTLSDIDKDEFLGKAQREEHRSDASLSGKLRLRFMNQDLDTGWRNDDSDDAATCSIPDDMKKSSFYHLDGDDPRKSLDEIVNTFGEKVSPMLFTTIAMWQLYEADADTESE